LTGRRRFFCGGGRRPHFDDFLGAVFFLEAAFLGAAGAFDVLAFLGFGFSGIGISLC
jgi:hypothetical protein